MGLLSSLVAAFRQSIDTEEAKFSASVETDLQSLHANIDARMASLEGAGARELALARTKLHEAELWLVAHLHGIAA